MATTIDYWFTTSSPWSYLGHDPFLSIARRHGATVRYMPVRLAEVFPQTGGLPLSKRHPARQRYRLIDLQRWRARRGVTMTLDPPFFSADATLADCCAIALIGRGIDPGAYISRILHAKWTAERDPSTAPVLAEALAGSVDDPTALMAEARSEATLARYAGNAHAAVDADIFGAPTYVLNGEPFWGQDRLDLLDEALTAGRQAYRVT